MEQAEIDPPTEFTIQDLLFWIRAFLRFGVVQTILYVLSAGPASWCLNELPLPEAMQVLLWRLYDPMMIDVGYHMPAILWPPLNLWYSIWRD